MGIHVSRESRIYYGDVLDIVELDSLEIVFMQIFCASQRFLGGTTLFKETHASEHVLLFEWACSLSRCCISSHSKAKSRW